MARRHRRMQLGLGLHAEDDRRTERIAARPSFDAIEQESRWVLVFGSALAIALAVALWVRLSGGAQAPEPRADATLPLRQTPRIVAVGPIVAANSPAVLPANALRWTDSTRAPAFPTPAPAPVRYEPPRAPAVAPSFPAPQAAPAPDYAARDRRIAELKRQSDALDDLARNVRANTGVSHSSDTQFPDYRSWRHQHNGWTNSESLNQYLKALDQHRNEVRREKWQLEGR